MFQIPAWDCDREGGTEKKEKLSYNKHLLSVWLDTTHLVTHWAVGHSFWGCMFCPSLSLVSSAVVA